jgi:ketosteroid isomerase-like protein
MALYTADAVFMAQHFPTAVGTQAVQNAYDTVFSMITLSVEFDIIEVVPVTDTWAFARTASAGTTIVKNGGGGPEDNQEFFVFKKVEGIWKIARYCFSTTNPPR